MMPMLHEKDTTLTNHVDHHVAPLRQVRGAVERRNHVGVVYLAAK